ncbi:Hsp20/alpha crystallin family protein [uncultured Clostridium sp.]|uniref:Hsp20/alpha crystallin family protein n=1 Tax=uncultured Clostridium sp. TaxID=59620 RepID=UPI0025F17A12|nr:Hsp20/alpha crystallin family protein [uncultured Clostridium sp.]
MFGMFPFNWNGKQNQNYNNSNHYGYNNYYNKRINNTNTINSFSNLLNNIMGQILSSDFIADLIAEMEELINDMEEEDFYDVQLYDYGEYYIIQGYLPGIEFRDLHIEFPPNKVILTLTQRQTYSNGVNSMMTVMRTGGNLIKTFIVEDLDIPNSTASFEDNFLLITLKKVHKQLPCPSNNVIVDIDDYKIE